MGLKPQDTKKGKRSRNTSGNSNHKLGDSWKRKLFALGREVLTQRSSSVERQRNELGEEERAALLLMALSYGCFHLGREGKKKQDKILFIKISRFQNCNLQFRVFAFFFLGPFFFKGMMICYHYQFSAMKSLSSFD